MRKLLYTIVLAVTLVGAVGSGVGSARPAAAECTVCVAQAGMMMNTADTQAAAMAALRAAALARLEAMRLRLPG